MVSNGWLAGPYAEQAEPCSADGSGALVVSMIASRGQRNANAIRFLAVLAEPDHRPRRVEWQAPD